MRTTAGVRRQVKPDLRGLVVVSSIGSFYLGLSRMLTNEESDSVVSVPVELGDTFDL